MDKTEKQGLEKVEIFFLLHPISARQNKSPVCVLRQNERWCVRLFVGTLERLLLWVFRTALVTHPR